MGVAQMKTTKQAKKGMRMRMAASPRRSVVRAVKENHATPARVRKSEVVRAKKSGGVEAAVKNTAVAMPAAGALLVAVVWS